MHRYHKVTNPGQKISLWDVHYADEIKEWNNRHEKVVTGTPSPNLKHPSSCFSWYYPKYNRFIVFDPRTQQGNPSNSTREFTPDSSPIHTTTQNEPTYHTDFNIPQHQTYIETTQNQPLIQTTQDESAYHSYQTPHQFPIFDRETYISPTTTQNYHPFDNQLTHHQNYHYPDPDTSTSEPWINQLLTPDDQQAYIFDRFLSSGDGIFPGATSGLFPGATSGFCPSATSGLSPDTTSSFATHISLENEPLADGPRGGNGPRRGSRFRVPPGCGTDGHLKLNEVEDADRGRGGHRGCGRGHVGH
jgi:hypothetical protein